MAFKGAKKWETPPSTTEKAPIFSGIRRIPADQRARERIEHEARELEEQKREKLSHFASVSDLQKYLKMRGLDDACRNVVQGVSECDPMKFESAMLDDLIKARVEGCTPEQINRLRDLILAGSRMTYKRRTTDEIMSEFTLLREMKRRHPEVATKIAGVKTREDEQWGHRKRNALRDPSTLLEIERDRAEASDELTAVEQCVRDHLTGEDAERATRTIEDLMLRNWTELKKTLIAHGLSIEAARNNGFTRPLFSALEDLRHIRDLLYYRRIHADWAKIAYAGETSVERKISA